MPDRKQESIVRPVHPKVRVLPVPYIDTQAILMARTIFGERFLSSEEGLVHTQMQMIGYRRCHQLTYDPKVAFRA